jgi:hypothetical protein
MPVVIERGDKGIPVLAIQNALNQAEASGAPLVLDGIFGPKTEAAVKAFQKREGLATDGDVGPLTLGRLFVGARPQTSVRVAPVNRLVPARANSPFAPPAGPPPPPPGVSLGTVGQLMRDGQLRSWFDAPTPFPALTLSPLPPRLRLSPHLFLQAGVPLQRVPRLSLPGQSHLLRPDHNLVFEAELATEVSKDGVEFTAEAELMVPRASPWFVPTVKIATSPDLSQTAKLSLKTKLFELPVIKWDRLDISLMGEFKNSLSVPFHGGFETKDVFPKATSQVLVGPDLTFDIIKGRPNFQLFFDMRAGGAGTLSFKPGGVTGAFSGVLEGSAGLRLKFGLFGGGP